MGKSVPSNAVFTDTTYSKLSQFSNDVGYITGITKAMVTNALGYTPSSTDTNTTYSQATSSTLGLVKIGYSTSGKNYAVQLNSSGQMYVNVPWTDTDTNTTYSNATTSAAGLMSASDKSKLDAITASADSVSYSQNWSGGEKIGTITINGTGIDIYSPGITSSLSSTSGITALSASAGKSLQDQINNIGLYNSYYNRDGMSLASNTGDNLVGFLLPVGTYILIGNIQFSANSTGIRMINFTNIANYTLGVLAH